MIEVAAMEIFSFSRFVASIKTDMSEVSTTVAGQGDIPNMGHTSQATFFTVQSVLGKRKRTDIEIFEDNRSRWVIKRAREFEPGVHAMQRMGAIAPKSRDADPVPCPSSNDVPQENRRFDGQSAPRNSQTSNAACESTILVPMPGKSTSDFAHRFTETTSNAKHEGGELKLVVKLPINWSKFIDRIMIANGTNSTAGSAATSPVNSTGADGSKPADIVTTNHPERSASPMKRQNVAPTKQDTRRRLEPSTEETAAEELLPVLEGGRTRSSPGALTITGVILDLEGQVDEVEYQASHDMRSMAPAPRLHPSTLASSRITKSESATSSMYTQSKSSTSRSLGTGATVSEEPISHTSFAKSDCSPLSPANSHSTEPARYDCLTMKYALLPAPIFLSDKGTQTDACEDAAQKGQTSSSTIPAKYQNYSANDINLTPEEHEACSQEPFQLCDALIKGEPGVIFMGNKFGRLVEKLKNTKWIVSELKKVANTKKREFEEDSKVADEKVSRAQSDLYGTEAGMQARIGRGHVSDRLMAKMKETQESFANVLQEAIEEAAIIAWRYTSFINRKKAAVRKLKATKRTIADILEICAEEYFERKKKDPNYKPSEEAFADDEDEDEDVEPPPEPIPNDLETIKERAKQYLAKRNFVTDYEENQNFFDGLKDETSEVIITKTAKKLVEDKKLELRYAKEMLKLNRETYEQQRQDILQENPDVPAETFTRAFLLAGQELAGNVQEAERALNEAKAQAMGVCRYNANDQASHFVEHEDDDPGNSVYGGGDEARILNWHVRQPQYEFEEITAEDTETEDVDESPASWNSVFQDFCDHLSDAPSVDTEQTEDLDSRMDEDGDAIMADGDSLVNADEAWETISNSPWCDELEMKLRAYQEATRLGEN